MWDQSIYKYDFGENRRGSHKEEGSRKNNRIKKGIRDNRK